MKVCVCFGGVCVCVCVHVWMCGWMCGGQVYISDHMRVGWVGGHSLMSATLLTRVHSTYHPSLLLCRDNTVQLLHTRQTHSQWLYVSNLCTGAAFK